MFIMQFITQEVYDVEGVAKSFRPIDKLSFNLQLAVVVNENGLAQNIYSKSLLKVVYKYLEALRCTNQFFSK